MDSLTLSQLDLWIIAGYLVAVALIGALAARRTHTAQDLFLAGRRLGAVPIGLSLFASNISSTTLIGLAGAAYAWGIAVANYEWMAAPVLVFMALLVAPVYLRARITTVPEFFEQRFDPRVRRYFSALTLFANIVVDTAGTLFAGALVLSSLVPNLSLGTAALVLAAVAGLYTAAGGLAAVVYTDVLQALILLAGSALVAWTAYTALGASPEAVAAAAPTPGHLSFFLPLDDPNLPWLGTLIGVPILGFYFWCTNQFIVQRVLGAHSVEAARWGMLLAAVLKLAVVFLMVLPGVMAHALLPPLEDGDLVFPALVSELLPAGLTGLVMAALAAALMSSIDSTLNSAATLLTWDWVRPLRPGMSDRRIAWIGRGAIVGFMFLAAAIAPAIGRFEGLFQYLQTALAYLVPPVAAVFLAGFFAPRVGARAALRGLLGGHLVSAALFALYLSGLSTLHFTLIAGILFAASLVLTLLPIGPQETPADRPGYRPGLTAPEGRFDYRWAAGLVLVLTASLIWLFR
ncbi:MAG: sodium/solute symporter [Gammaproteobacteria bacterium]|jgi:SSS family solute:Na+ symporter